MATRPELTHHLIQTTYDMHAAWKLLSKENEAQREKFKLAMGDLNTYESGDYIATLFEHERNHVDLITLRAFYPDIAHKLTTTNRYWKLEIIKRMHS